MPMTKAHKEWKAAYEKARETMGVMAALDFLSKSSFGGYTFTVRRDKAGAQVTICGGGGLTTSRSVDDRPSEILGAVEGLLSHATQSDRWR